MPWSATFLANFEQFDAALRSAEPKLGAFDQNVKKVQRSLQTMTSEFDGTKITQQASTMATAIEKAGGAAALTDKELRKANATLQEAIEKYHKLGQTAPSALTSMGDAIKARVDALDQATQKTTAWGGAFTTLKGLATGFVAGFTIDRILTGIGSAISSTAEWTNKVADLAEKYRISTDAVQKASYAASQNGTELEPVLKGMQELSKKIGENGKEAATALGALGLSVAQLKGLSPDEQFRIVSERLAGVADQGEQAAIASDLLGKSWKELAPAMTDEFRRAYDAAQDLGQVISHDTIKSFDTLSDSWTTLKGAATTLIGEALSPLARALAEVATGFDRMNEAAGRSSGAIWPKGSVGAGNRAPGAENLIDQTPFAYTPVFSGLTIASSKIKEATEQSATAVVRHARAVEAAAASVERSVALRDSNIFSRDVSAAGIMQRLTQVPSLLTAPGGLTETIPGWSPWGGIAQITNAMGYTRGTIGGGGASGGGFNWSNLLQLIGGGASAFGGGTTFGSMATGGLSGAAIGAGISGMMSSLVGASVLGPLAPIGMAVGAAIPLLKRLFAPSAGAVAGKQADQQIGNLQSSLLSQYGSVDAIAGMGSEGAALAAAWGSKNVAGLEHFTRLMKEFTEAQGEALEQQNALNEAMAFLTEHGTNAWKDMQAAASEFGIDVAALGPAFAQGKFSDEVDNLVRKFELLRQGGADVGGVVQGMADEVSAFVQRGKEMGLEFPESMRPVIEELFRTGQLLDENGDKITDISDLKFVERSDPLMQGIDTLIDAMKDVAKTLSDLLPKAAREGAQGVTDAFRGVEVHIPWKYEQTGDEPTSHSYAGGTGGIRDFGSGTLAMLHGREAVVTEAEYQRGAGGGKVEITIRNVLDGRLLSEQLVEYLPTALRRAGLAVA